VKTGRAEDPPFFLALHSGPMLAAYDLAAGGKLADAIVAQLTRAG
jgi:hypothetical protein